MLARLVLLVLLAAPCLAESVHVTDDRQLGAGVFYAPGLEGHLSGVSTGRGNFDQEPVETYSLMATLPFEHTDVDLVVAHLTSTTIARGAFTFDGVFFPGGANVDLELNWIELVGRLRAIDRPHLRLSLLGGARVLDAEIDARTTTRSARYEDVHVLPEAGALLEARVYPRSTLYGLVKYMDVTAKTEGNYTLQLEGGLSYLLPAPTDDYFGWRVTGGVRYLNLQVTDRVGRPDQVRYDVLATGPFVEATRVF